MTKEYTTAGEEQTEALGFRLGQLIQPGAVIAYTGDLGAGKTAFTRGLARGLGIPDRVTSPTFTIVNEYEGGRLPLFHFDMYRLGSSDELFDIGWEDYLARGGVCAVSGAKMWTTPWTRMPSGWTSAGVRRTTSGSSPSPAAPI